MPHSPLVNDGNSKLAGIVERLEPQIGPPSSA